MRHIHTHAQPLTCSMNIVKRHTPIVRLSNVQTFELMNYALPNANNFKIPHT